MTHPAPDTPPPDGERVLRNTFVLTAGEVLGQLANLLFVASFARAYGVVEMGRYSLAMAIGSVAGLAISLGTHTYLVRELARSPAPASRYVAAVARWQWRSLAATTILAAMALATRNEGFGVMMAAIAYQFLYRAGGLYYAPFRAAERMHVPVAADVAQRFLILALGGTLMLAEASAQVTALAMIVGAASYFIAGHQLARHRFGPPPVVEPGETARLLRASWPFLGTLVLAVLYTRGAPLLLGLLLGAEAVGGYAAADRVFAVATLLAVMFGNAAMPALSRLARQAPGDALSLAARLLRLVLIAAFSLTAALFTFATDIVGLIFGTAYVAAIPLLQVLSLSIPVQAMEQFLVAQLVAAGHQRLLVVTRGISLICFAAAGTAFTLLHGPVGLAWAVVVASSIQLAGAMYVLRREVALPITLATVLPPAITALAAGYIVVVLQEAPLPLRAVAFAGTVVIVACASGALRRQDLGLLRALLRPLIPSGTAR